MKFVKRLKKVLKKTWIAKIFRKIRWMIEYKLFHDETKFCKTYKEDGCLFGKTLFCDFPNCDIENERENKEEKLEIYRNALDKWGVEAQMTMVYEELGELETALARYERGRVASEDVITELADVTIMCEQMALLLGYDDYEKEIENKLERVVKRLNR